MCLRQISAKKFQKEKKSEKYCKRLSAEAVAWECIKGSGNFMLQHYSRFLTPSSLFSLPAFLLIYFCRLSSLASHVQYIRNKICPHISNAEHLSLGEERGGEGGGYYLNKKAVVQSLQRCDGILQQS